VSKDASDKECITDGLCEERESVSSSSFPPIFVSRYYAIGSECRVKLHGKSRMWVRSPPGCSNAARASNGGNAVVSLTFVAAV
jgi:hypothetical protein